MHMISFSLLFIQILGFFGKSKCMCFVESVSSIMFDIGRIIIFYQRTNQYDINKCIKDASMFSILSLWYFQKMWFVVYFLNRLFCFFQFIFYVLVESIRNIFNHYLLFTLSEMFWVWVGGDLIFTLERFEWKIRYPNNFREFPSEIQNTSTNF